MRAIKRLGAGALGLLVALLAWGVLVEPYLIDREEQTAPIDRLPPAWEGRRVALIADLQVGMWLDNLAAVRQAVVQIVEERPALVLIAGDFMYEPRVGTQEKIRRAVELVRPLPAAGIPTYAVLGNHDYAVGFDPATDLPPVLRRAVGGGGALAGAQRPAKEPAAPIAAELRQALERAGVVVLSNDAVPLPPPAGAGGVGPPLYLAGIAPHLPGVARPSLALEQVPDGAPRIVLMHNPASFEELPAGSAPLAVAGHTHGGQVRLPFLPDWSYRELFVGGPATTDGWIEGYGAPGNRLYVNRGIGFTALPVRINCPPEVTVFTLRSA